MKPISSLSFRDLVYIDTIDRCRSLTAAAQELYITQPALTKFLRRLEEELGTELFRWTGNHMVPTLAGEKYLIFARRLLAEKEAFERTMALEKWNQRLLRVGIPFNRGELFVSALIAFNRKYPDVRVEFLERPFPDIERSLDHCEIDLAFTNSPLDTDNWVVQTLWQEELRLYVSAAFPEPEWELGPAGRERVVELAQFAPCRFLVGSQEQLLGRMARRIFEENRFHPAQLFEMRNIPAMLQLAKAGYGLCFYGRGPRRESWSLSEAEARQGLYSFGSHAYVNQFCAVYSKKLRDDTLNREFISLVRSED